MADSRISALGVSGPLIQNALRIVRGQLTLVAGTASEAIPAGPSGDEDDVSMFAIHNAIGGTQGILRIDYLNGLVTVTSSNALDTGLVLYTLIFHN